MIYDDLMQLSCLSSLSIVNSRLAFLYLSAIFNLLRLVIKAPTVATKMSVDNMSTPIEDTNNMSASTTMPLTRVIIIASAEIKATIAETARAV